MADTQAHPISDDQARRRDTPLKPKGVWRPDSRLSQDIGEKLGRLMHPEAAQIRYRVTFGSVVLTGDVDDMRAAVLAEGAVRSVWGVQGVRNEVRPKLSH